MRKLRFSKETEFFLCQKSPIDKISHGRRIFWLTAHAKSRMVYCDAC